MARPANDIRIHVPDLAPIEAVAVNQTGDSCVIGWTRHYISDAISSQAFEWISELIVETREISLVYTPFTIFPD